MKTVPTEQSVQSYIASISPAPRQQDCRALLDMMARISGWPAKMWGASIVGFGQYHYKYDSGREGDYLRVGFSSRAKSISVYIMPGYQDFSHLLDRLGPHSMGKSCLYIQRLSDIDLSVLEALISEGLADMAQRYPL